MGSNALTQIAIWELRDVHTTHPSRLHIEIRIDTMPSDRSGFKEGKRNSYKGAVIGTTLPRVHVCGGGVGMCASIIKENHSLVPTHLAVPIPQYLLTKD